jgi:hypothetical protein
MYRNACQTNSGVGALSLSDKLGASDVAVLATRTLGDARAVNVRQVTLCCSRERRHRARARGAIRNYKFATSGPKSVYMLIGLRGKGHPFPRPPIHGQAVSAMPPSMRLRPPSLGARARAPRCVEQHKCGGTSLSRLQSVQ